MKCRELAKELAGDEWTLDNLTGLSLEELWTLEKMGLLEVVTVRVGEVHVEEASECLPVPHEVCLQ